MPRISQPSVKGTSIFSSEKNITVVGDRRFDNLSGSHLQSQVNSICQSMMLTICSLKYEWLCHVALWTQMVKCKLKCYVKPMKDPLGVSPSKGNQGTTRGKEKILLTSVGIEPTTSGLDLPLLCRLSYEVGQRLKEFILKKEFFLYLVWFPDSLY